MMDESNDDERALTEALRAVAIQDTHHGPSASVEAHLREEVRRRGARRRMYVATLGVAAALLAAASVPTWRMVRHRTAVTSTPVDVELPRPPAGVSEVSTAFLPLIYSNVPITNGEIVRLEVPRAALASFGLAPMEAVDAPPSSTVLADVLVGEDGLARAVRFVRQAATSAHGSTSSP